MRLSIVTKIILLFVGVILIFAAVSVYQVSQMRQTTRALYEINLGYVPLSKIVAQIDAAQKNQQADVERVLNLPANQAQKVVTRLVLDYFPRVLRQYIAQGIAHCDKLLLVTAVDPGKLDYRDFREKIVQLGELQDAYQKKVAYLVTEGLGNDDIQETARADVSKAERNLNRAVKVLSLRIDNEITKAFSTLEAQGDRAMWAGIGVSAAALVGAIVLALVSGFLLKPMRKLTEATQRLREGEYQTPIPVNGKDELGVLAREFDSMRQVLLERDRALTQQAAELERSNSELRTLKLHYENIIDNMSLPLMVADVHLRLTTVNPAAAEIWGQNRAAMTGQLVSGLPMANGTLGDKLDFRRVLKEKVRLVGDAMRILCTDGTEKRVSFSTLPFLDGESVKGLLVIGDDVTEQLQMESHLLRSERLAAIGRVASRITHEIRNPLSSISLNAEMLRDELSAGNPDGEELSTLLQSIIREVDRLHTTTEDYLSFARMPAARKSTVNLNVIVSNLAEFYRAELDRKQITSEIDLTEKAPLVFADENQLIQVIHNLIKNAMEAMTSGGELKLITEFGDAKHRIRIIDSGPGIATDIGEKVFEPFYSTKPQGTGLGLALGNQFITESGGLLFHEPAEGGGTQFVIELPRKEEISSAKAS